MAEFREVMKQWRRFCKSHSNCGECEFDGNGICGEAHLSEVPYAGIELRIMAWAAEHPEPVYPVWRDWLRDLYGNSNMTMTDILESPIDPEIAQRLNIVPRRMR